MKTKSENSKVEEYLKEIAQSLQRIAEELAAINEHANHDEYCQ